MKDYKSRDALDDVYGEGTWLTTPPPPCRHTGGRRTVKVRASKNRKAHTRQQPILSRRRIIFANYHKERSQQSPLV